MENDQQTPKTPPELPEAPDKEKMDQVRSIYCAVAVVMVADYVFLDTSKTSGETVWPTAPQTRRPIRGSKRRVIIVYTTSTRCSKHRRCAKAEDEYHQGRCDLPTTL
jgi:hypothetical protein